GGGPAGGPRARLLHAAVEPELVAEHHERSRERRPDVAHRLHRELLDCRFVDRHHGPPWVGLACNGKRDARPNPRKQARIIDPLAATSGPGPEVAPGTHAPPRRPGPRDRGAP